MGRRPFQHQCKRTARQRPGDNLKRIDSDDRFGVAIARMEMGRFVVTPIHRDHDPEKYAEGWHIGSRCRGSAIVLRGHHAFDRSMPKI
jgi:hypothetical protein